MTVECWINGGSGIEEKRHLVRDWILQNVGMTHQRFEELPDSLPVDRYGVASTHDRDAYILALISGMTSWELEHFMRFRPQRGNQEALQSHVDHNTSWLEDMTFFYGMKVKHDPSDAEMLGDPEQRQAEERFFAESRAYWVLTHIKWVERI